MDPSDKSQKTLTWEAEIEDCGFESSLGYGARLPSPNQKKGNLEFYHNKTNFKSSKNTEEGKTAGEGICYK
jgi:hypothetical protein